MPVVRIAVVVVATAVLSLPTVPAVAADLSVSTSLPASVTAGAVEPAVASTSVAGSTTDLEHQQLTYDLSGVAGLTAADVALRCQPDDSSTALADVALTAHGDHLVGTCGDFSLAAGASRTTALRLSLGTGSPTGTLTVSTSVGDVGGAAAATSSTTIAVVGPPAAPTALTATPGDGQATVGFTPGDTGGSPVTWFATAHPPTGPDVTASGTTSPLTLTGLVNGPTYSVAVVGRNASGDGPPATTTVQPYAPSGPPRDVVASPGDGSLSVSFAPPATNPGVVVSYTASAGGRSTTGPTSPLIVTGLTNGPTYAVTVTATDVRGASATSAAVPGAAYSAPSAPTSVTATPGDGSVTLSFAAPATNPGVVTGYTVTTTPADGGAVVTTTGPASPITVGGLTDGRAYASTVAAQTSATAPGPASDGVTATPFGTPGAPGVPQLLAGERDLVATFTAAPDRGAAVTGYTATATPVGGGPSVSVSGPASPLRIGGLRDGVPVTVAVTANNAAGTGPATTSPTTAVPTPRVAVSIAAAPRTVTAGQPLLLSGHTSRGLQSVALVEVLGAGGSRVDLGAVTSDAAGRFALHVPATRTGRIHAEVADLDADGAYLASSPALLVSVRSLAVIRAVRVDGGHLVVTGTLSPGQLVKGPHGYAALSLWLVDAHGHRLLRLGRGTAGKAPRSSATSAFRLTGTLPPAGLRRVEVVVDAAAQSTGSTSAPATLMVT